MVSLQSTIAKKSSANNIPFEVAIEVTSSCNLRCSYCYIDHNNHKTISVDTFASLIDQLKKLGTSVVVITGGEPFLHPQLDLLISICEEKKMLIVLYTNGTIPLDDKMKKVIQNPWIIRIEMTMYGTSEHSYATFCGNGAAYHTFMTNLAILHEIGKRLVIKVVPQKVNYKELPEMRRIAKIYHAILGINLLLFENDYGKIDNLILNDSELAFVVREEKASPQSGYSVCGAGRNSFCIKADGRMQVCFLSDTNIGNIYTDDLYNIWHTSQVIAEHRKLSNPEDCNHCDFESFCNKCLVLRRAANTERNNIEAFNEPYICRLARIRKEVFKSENAISKTEV